MRLSTVILPIYPWAQARALWQQAEELGLHAAYTYDHLSWRSFRDQPWYGTVPTLAAAATVTSRIRLGTMVTSPNFRHPVPFAKEVMSLDDLSGGRLVLGVGAGGTGFDASALGGSSWSAAERSDRFDEFVRMLDTLLTQPATSYAGRFWSAHDVRNAPGCVQTPRVPFAIAATGPRGMELAATFGQSWITIGDPTLAPDATASQRVSAVAAQVHRLAEVTATLGRDPADLKHVLLTGTGVTMPLDSVDHFIDAAGTIGQSGIDELVVHWPVPDSVYAADLDIFSRIMTEAPAQLELPSKENA